MNGILETETEVVPHEVKVDAGQLGLDERPQAPEEMRSLVRERKGNVHKGLAPVCCGERNVICNYPTQLTRAYTDTKPMVNTPNS